MKIIHRVAVTAAAASLGLIPTAATAASSPQCIGSSSQCVSGTYNSATNRSVFDPNTSGSSRTFYLVVNGTTGPTFRGGTNNYTQSVSGRAFGKICEQKSGTDPCSALVNT